MKIKYSPTYLKVTFTQSELKTGITDAIERLPIFGWQCSMDNLRWQIEVAYKDKFDELVKKYFTDKQLSLF